VSRKSREARQREPPGDVGSDSSRSCKTREDQPAGDRSNPSSVPRAGAGGGVARDTYVEIPFRKAYLGSIVDRLEVAAARCIVGRKDVLEQAALAAPPCQGFAVLYANGAPYRMKLRTPMLLRLRRNRSYYLQVGM
jgi:hypothetical protein